jgi:hypothetical protein
MSKLAPHHAILIRLYSECGMTVDRLPYTPQFDNMYRSVVALTRTPFTEQEVWNELIGLRKKGCLPTRQKEEVIEN